MTKVLLLLLTFRRRTNASEAEQQHFRSQQEAALVLLGRQRDALGEARGALRAAAATAHPEPELARAAIDGDATARTDAAAPRSAAHALHRRLQSLTAAQG